MTTTQDPHAVIKSALFEAQRLVEAVSKDAHNDHHKYNYASADAIITEARRCLHQVGLAVLPVGSVIATSKMSDTDDKGVIFEWTQERLDLTFEVFHSPSGTSMSWPPFSVAVIPERGRPLDKAEAGARTYAMSYFLRELLLIPRTGADDRDGQSDEPRQRAPARQERRRDQAPRQPPQGQSQPGPATPPRDPPPPQGASSTKPAPEKKPADPCEVVGRMMSAIQVLDGQAGAGGEGIAKAMELLGGKAPKDLERGVAIALLGGADAPGALRKLRDDLKARAAAKTAT